MDRFAHYGWPFFESRHAPLAREAEAWAKDNLGHAHGDNADAICRRLVQDLGCAGYLNHCVSEKPDVRSIAILPRIIGQGRAAELLYTGRAMSADEGLAWGFFNKVVDPALPIALEVAQDLSTGPTLAHAVTKKMLHQEWNVTVDQAIDMEAVAQAELMQTKDFLRAYEAFAAKKKPVFQGD